MRESNSMSAPVKTITAEQCRMIRNSIESIRPMSESVGLLFYGKLFELAPSVHSMFHIDLALQVQKLMGTLSAIVESLNGFETIRPKLEELGRKHATYGVRVEHYETLAAALLWTMNEALGADFDAPTSEARSVALAAVSKAMTAHANDSTP